MEMKCTFIKAEKERGMKKMKPRKPLLQFVMLALVSIVTVLSLSGESFAALNCTNCHGDNLGTDARPLDVPNGSPITYRNITTGAVTGNHSEHMAKTVDPAMCNRCHNNANYTSSHRNGMISLKNGMNFSASGTYTSPNLQAGAGFVFKNQTSVPTLGSCSTVNCHFEKTTPIWGANPASIGCSTCHDASPVTYAHTTHTAKYSCDNCHAPRTTFQHATSAGNAGRNIDLKGTKMATAAYTGSNWKFLPSQSGRLVGQCDNVYCHSNGQANGGVLPPNYAASPPIWSGTVSCGDCHGTLPINLTTGSHQKHLVANGNCNTCHNGATPTSNSQATHVDGSINVDAAGVTYSQGASHAPGNGYGSCSVASCHANVYAAGTIATPVWGVTAANCTACHTTPIATTGPATGSHVKHNNTNCSLCHLGATNNTTIPTSNHANGTIEATGGYPVTAKHAAGTYTGTCSTASCHANPYGTGSVITPVWGVAAANCIACHTTPIATTGPATGSHVKHNNTDCSQCHLGATNNTTIPTSNHANGTIEATGGYPVTAKHAAGTYTGTCSTATCHANVYAAGTIATPVWGATVANCTACHSIPITASGPATGAHVKHAAKGTVCTACHVAGTSATTPPSTGHADGNIDVIAGSYPASVTKHVSGSGYASCSNVSCHNGPASNPFTAPAINWGAAPSCTNCHGYPPAGTNHTGVVGKCNSCHSDIAADGITIRIPAQHLDGIVQGGKCNACHGYPPVQTMTGLGTNANYSSAKLQNYSGGGGVHAVAGHLALNLKVSQNLGFTPCLVCHPSISHNEGFGSFSTHQVQVVVDAKFKFDKNRPIVYNAKQSGIGKTSGTCTNVECHFQKSPIWSSQPYTQAH